MYPHTYSGKLSKNEMNRQCAVANTRCTCEKKTSLTYAVERQLTLALKMSVFKT
jgi:hypothetical protein